MFLLFDARCARCDNPFKVEAEADVVPPRGAVYRYTCPRCYAPGTAAAGDGRPSDTTTAWAVRASAAE
jgi:hypothetical protein